MSGPHENPLSHEGEGRGEGVRRRLPRHRNLVLDLMHHSQRVPTVAEDRILDLSQVATLRAACQPRISWPVLFLKAYARVASAHPVLRQSYQRWPWPHLYEHPENIGVMTISREFDDAEWLFFARFIAPETTPLRELQRLLEYYQRLPVERVFRLQLRLSGWPLPLRRLVWNQLIHWQPRRRAKHMGTFGQTSVSSAGATIQQPLSIATSTIGYGPLDEHQHCRFTITYDHRLMDGLEVARMLAEVQVEFDGAISEELATLASASD